MDNPPQTASDAVRAAQDIRLLYEKYSFYLVPSIVAVVVFVLIGACLIDTKYGADVIDRVLKVSGTIMEFLSILLGGTGLTMARGHMDQRINGDQH